MGYGTVAVDPKVIPLRSRLWVEGYGFCIALDVGSAIKGRKPVQVLVIDEPGS